jgi:hypothetical protein
MPAQLTTAFRLVHIHYPIWEQLGVHNVAHSRVGAHFAPSLAPGILGIALIELERVGLEGLEEGWGEWRRTVVPERLCHG